MIWFSFIMLVVVLCVCFVCRCWLSGFGMVCDLGCPLLVVCFIVLVFFLDLAGVGFRNVCFVVCWVLGCWVWVLM